MNLSLPDKPTARKDHPILSARFSRLITPLHRCFDALCHSTYNPLYRSGTIAVLMFLVLVVTGVYLLLFYKVGAPHASMLQIVDRVWLGSFMRGLHRFATNVAIIAALFHLLQILLQGKTWGPRFLAWTSGILMLGLIYIAAWSGYVMVWDQHGQLFAESGARLISALPFLRDTMREAFAGVRPMPSSFFFMNLFLHVAVPLLFVIGLLVHTARIKRTQWLPPRPILYGGLLLGIIYAGWFAPPLLPEANLLNLIPKIPLDLFSGFWIPFISLIGEPAVFWISIGLFFVALSVPFWWKPANQMVDGPSQVDALRCSGCTQCATDCPYEAISMQPTGTGRKLIAQVEGNLCVRCGVCLASCDDVAIGLADQNGEDQAKRVTELAEYLAIKVPMPVALVVCGNNPGVEPAAETLGLEANDYFIFPLHCAGTLHNLTMKELLKYAKRIVIWSCPERVCQNRDGLTLFRERLERRRVPFLDKTIDRSRISFMPRASWEVHEVEAEMRGRKVQISKFRLVAGTLCIATVFLLILRQGAEFNFGRNPGYGVLRIAGHIPGGKQQNCRALTEQEKTTIPRHMQRPSICEEQKLEFTLRVTIDGQQIITRKLDQRGWRSDRPVYLNESIELEAGTHGIEASLIPEGEGALSKFGYSLSDQQTLEVGQILLLVPDSINQTFKVVPR